MCTLFTINSPDRPLLKENYEREGGRERRGKWSEIINKMEQEKECMLIRTHIDSCLTPHPEHIFVYTEHSQKV